MSFSSNVYKAVKKIPFGLVATYGDIALMIEEPRSARQVGFALRNLGLNEQKVPWWRIVNTKGYLSINQGMSGNEKLIQKELLESEGINVSEDCYLDLKKYRFLK